MKFFVRNLFTKMLLLALLAAPLAVYALAELKQLAQAGSRDSGKENNASNATDAELKVLQEQAARFVAMPSDLRRELLIPAAVGVKLPAEPPYHDLAKSVKERSDLLAAQKRFLEECSLIKADSKAPAFQGGDLAAHYARIWSDRRDMAQRRDDIARLRALLSKSSGPELERIAKEMHAAIDKFLTQWGDDPEIRQALEQLRKREIESRQDELKASCDKWGSDYLKVLNSPTPATLKSLGDDLDKLLKELRAQESELRIRSDPSLDWTKTQIALWDSRRGFLTRAVGLFENADQALTASKVEQYLTDCDRLYKDAPSEEARQLVRGMAEAYCKKYVSQPPQQPLRFDDKVLLIGSDNVAEEVPREQVYVGQAKGGHRWLTSGDPIKKDGYTEFHAANDKTAEYLTAYDKARNNPLRRSLTDLKLTALKPTPKSQAVFVYCEEIAKVEQWNGANIRAFHKKCEVHKEHLGDVWNRLQALAAAVDRAKDLFGDAAK